MLMFSLRGCLFRYSLNGVPMYSILILDMNHKRINIIKKLLILETIYIFVTIQIGD